MGWSQYRIGQHLGTSQVQVCNDLKIIRQRYANSQLQERHAMVAMKMDQYADMLAELWDAWQRSQLPSHKRVRETTPERPCAACRGTGQFARTGQGRQGPRHNAEGTVPCMACQGTGRKGGLLKTTSSKEERLPGAEYMNQIRQVHKDIRDLLGLDAPVRVNVQQVTVDFDAVAANLPTTFSHTDTVEQRIAKAIEASLRRLPNGLKEINSPADGLSPTSDGPPIPPSTNGEDHDSQDNGNN